MEPVTLTKIVRDIRLEERISAKTERPYKKLVIELANGYNIEYFVDRAELKLLELLLAEKDKNS